MHIFTVGWVFQFCKFKTKISHTLLSSWIGRVHSNSTEAFLSLNVSLHFNVSLLAPACSPRVLDQTVFGSVTASPISNCSNTMIEPSRPTSSREYPAWVKLECGSTGINGNWNRLICYCQQQSRLAVCRDLFVACDRGCTGSFFLGVACAIGCRVWVSCFCSNALILDNELNTVFHVASFASMIIATRVSVDEFLLRKWDQLTSCDLSDPFCGSNCWECPATSCSSKSTNEKKTHWICRKICTNMLSNNTTQGDVFFNFFPGNITSQGDVEKGEKRTTLALILNGSDRAFLPPVHASQHCIHVFVPKFCSFGLPKLGGLLVAVMRGLEFFVSNICKLIDAQLVKSIPCPVERFNELHVVLEYLIPHFSFCVVLVHTPITGNPLLMPLRHGWFRQCSRHSLRSPQP